MRRSLRFLLMMCVFALAAPPAYAGFGRDPYHPVVVAPTAFTTLFGSAASDGSGGMYVTWTDNSASGDIYLQRLTGSGAVVPGWPAAGLVVCNAAGLQRGSVLLADGAGGVFVAWEDGRSGNRDIYTAHVLGNASLAPGWAANGVLVSVTGLSSTHDDFGPSLALDGAGGVFIAWTMQYSVSDDDLYGTHVSSAGTPTWNNVLNGPFGNQDAQQMLSDGSGGCFVLFRDNESGVLYHPKVQRFNAAGTSVWGPNYLGLGGSSSRQSGWSIAADGVGGVFGLCDDNAFGSFSNVVANHFLASGANDPQWSNYKPIAYEPNIMQYGAIAIADGSGGLLTLFNDARYGGTDLFAQRTGPYGVPYAGWPAGGVLVSSAAGSQFAESVIPDGSGGAIVAFLDNRYADYFLFASRVMGDGNLAPGWVYGGAPVDLGGLIDIAFTPPVAVPDGNGGALFAWSDMRGVTAYSGYEGIYAQNLDAFGACGDARPAITRIADVPNDQGGKLSLQWTASYLDANPSRTISQYTIWRRVPGAPAAAAHPTAAAATRTGATIPAPSTRPATRTTIDAGQVVYWEYVATEPARMLPGYSAVVSTTTDSMSAGNAKTSLMVIAESAGAVTFWPSAADSGYSVDNIPPYPPAPFAGTYGAGTTAMHWAAVLVPDLANYRLYRGTSASFVPGPSNLVASPVDTAYADAAGHPYYYRLTAVDAHGNESASTLLLPGGVLGVEGGAAPELAFAPPVPNPARGSSALAYTLPRDAHVRLALYDVSGRQVRVLADGPQVAGSHTLAWDLRDDSGRAVGAGLYFARFESEGRVITRRVVTLE